MKASNDLKQYVDVVSSNGVTGKRKTHIRAIPQAQDVMQDFLKMQLLAQGEIAAPQRQAEALIKICPCRQLQVVILEENGRTEFVKK